jgi:hypothetical protein
MKLEISRVSKFGGPRCKHESRLWLIARVARAQFQFSSTWCIDGPPSDMLQSPDVGISLLFVRSSNGIKKQHKAGVSRRYADSFARAMAFLQAARLSGPISRAGWAAATVSCKYQHVTSRSESRRHLVDVQATSPATQWQRSLHLAIRRVTLPAAISTLLYRSAEQCATAGP